MRVILERSPHKPDKVWFHAVASALLLSAGAVQAAGDMPAPCRELVAANKAAGAAIEDIHEAGIKSKREELLACPILRKAVPALEDSIATMHRVGIECTKVSEVPPLVIDDALEAYTAVAEMANKGLGRCYEIEENDPE